MNIYKHELRTNFRSVLIWSGSIAALILLFMSIYPGFASDAALLEQMMSKFPRELLIAFGMTNMDWSSVLGYFGLVFLFCQICLAIQAANYGFSLVSIEENELTADFLLAKPVSRIQIMNSKFLAALTSLTITNIVVWIASFLFINIFNNGKAYSTGALVMLLLSILVFQLFFLTVGLIISLLVKRVRNVTPFSMALVFGLYILNAFGGMLGDESLEVISPFKHFDPNYILKNAAFDPLVLVSITIILISVVASYLLYGRRNMISAV
jgi:ABC-2 type transport system permease protein